MTVDAPIYYLVTVNCRGQVSEGSWTTDRADVVAERDAILAKHPDWTCRIKVWS